MSSPRLRANVSSTATKDGLVLLDERTGKYWQLNKTGAVVLRCLLNGDSVERIADSIADGYDVDTVQCRREVDAVIEQLNAADLFTR